MVKSFWIVLGDGDPEHLFIINPAQPGLEFIVSLGAESRNFLHGCSSGSLGHGWRKYLSKGSWPCEEIGKTWRRVRGVAPYLLLRRIPASAQPSCSYLPNRDNLDAIERPTFPGGYCQFEAEEELFKWILSAASVTDTWKKCERNP